MYFYFFFNIYTYIDMYIYIYVYLSLSISISLLFKSDGTCGTGVAGMGLRLDHWWSVMISDSSDRHFWHDCHVTMFTVDRCRQLIITPLWNTIETGQKWAAQRYKNNEHDQMISYEFKWSIHVEQRNLMRQPQQLLQLSGWKQRHQNRRWSEHMAAAIWMPFRYC